ncbi:glycosyltransferase family 2 protein [Prosthecomicrobium hirschii]|uniref:glycosyltransferase family 2 protein n=1 Tax=Prosthecodimorpha hirschii TaxID=665126 RepID=UPI0013648F7D|nr:glycosyltransferase family 2 protein [Prosthecomicrobium hirschii]
MVSALAILCARNERDHALRTIRLLIESRIDVVLIDHESTDGTRAAAADLLGRGLLSIEHLPWRGSFSLTDQLRMKAELGRQAPHDWIVHVDADEWLCSPHPGQSLLEGISAADAAGANAINFDEFVFVPTDQQSFDARTCHEAMLQYYFFQPSYPRLMRAWKRDAGLDNQTRGGHKLTGAALNLHGQDFILRHYIVLSALHAQEKYLGRRFSEEDWLKGWHRSRAQFRPEDLQLPPAAELHRLPHWTSKDFIKTAPRKTHFWSWTKA